MDYFKEFDFKAPKQNRVVILIENVMQALKELAQSGDLAELTTRELSNRSGYSLSTIFHHFKKFDDVFIYLFLIRRKQANLEIAELINNHPTEQPLSVLASVLTNHIIDKLLIPNRKTLLFIVNLFLRRTKNPERLNMETDMLVPIWMNIYSRDKTNTFYKFSENELRQRLRALQSIIRSPFLEDDPMAGTAEHRKIALNIFMRLFTKPD